jgi:hypothetical protein
MWQRFRELVGPILTLFVILVVVFMFLGLEMSSPYTREGPECSVWCALGHKIENFLGARDATAVE